MNDDVDGLSEHGRRVGGDHDAPWRVVRADNFAQVAPGLGRIAVDGADDFERVLLAHRRAIDAPMGPTPN